MIYHMHYDMDGTPHIVRDADGAWIPQDDDNGDFRDFLAWNAAQPVPLDYTTPGPKARRTRSLWAIHDDVEALSPNQRGKVWNDLNAASPPKYRAPGPHAPHILTLFCADKLLPGNPPVTHTQLGIIVYYVADNPDYLVAPAFDPSIMIPGDEPGDEPP